MKKKQIFICRRRRNSPPWTGYFDSMLMQTGLEAFLFKKKAVWGNLLVKFFIFGHITIADSFRKVIQHEIRKEKENEKKSKKFQKFPWLFHNICYNYCYPTHERKSRLWWILQFSRPFFPVYWISGKSQRFNCRILFRDLTFSQSPEQWLTGSFRPWWSVLVIVTYE